MILDICSNMAVIRVIAIVKTLLKVTFIVIPILLIIKAILDLYKAMINGQKSDDIKKSIINRVVAAIIVFLVFPIVNLLFKIEPLSNSDFLSCYNKINSIKDIEMLKVASLNVFGGVSVSKQEISCFGETSCEVSLPTPERGNDLFLGWSKTSNSCNNLIKNKITLTEDKTNLYPCFKEK